MNILRLLTDLYIFMIMWKLSLYNSNTTKCVTSSNSMDSDLEAFSHYPTDVSFAALPFQATALPNIWPNGSSRTKFGYYFEETNQ